MGDYMKTLPSYKVHLCFLIFEDIFSNSQNTVLLWSRFNIIPGKILIQIIGF